MLFLKNSIVINFTIMYSLLKEQMGVNVSYLSFAQDLAPKCYVMSQISVFFSIFAYLVH